MHPADRTNPNASRTWPFFVLALGFTWLLQLPAVLAKWGVIAGPAERFILPAALGGFSPLLSAWVVSRRESPRGPSVFASLRTWRVGFGWYIVALGLFTAIYASGNAVYLLCGGSSAGRWLYLPENGQQIAALFLIPFVEEPGWRGFALPRLQQRHNALVASLLLGVAWALWHTMMFILQGFTPWAFAIGMLNIIGGSVVFSWIYNHTRGSLLLAILAHAAVHLNNPTHSLPANVTPFVVYTASIWVVACALVVLDRHAWGSGATVD